MDYEDSRADIPDNPEKEPIYASPLMAERRERLLHETRKLLKERGLKGFSIRELCRRAEVAQRTLYNIFYSKDRLIGLAISESYEAVRQQLFYSTDPDTITGLVHRTIALNRGNLGARHYAEAIVTIYFDPSTQADLWDMLQQMSVVHVSRWLQRMRDQQMLEPWADIDAVAACMADMQYGVIRNWVAERLADEDYIYRVVEATLLSVMGVVRGESRQQAASYLQAMQQTGRAPDFPKAIIKASRQQN